MKEMERIAKENFEMVKRLHRGSSVISKQRQEMDYQNHLRYRKNLQKNTASSVLKNFNSSGGAVPPEKVNGAK